VGSRACARARARLDALDAVALTARADRLAAPRPAAAVMASWNLNAPVGYVTARSIDVIRHERTAHYYDPDALLCFMHGGSGALSNYLFEDVAVDMPGWAAVQVFIAPNIFARPAGPLGPVSTVVVRGLSSASAFLAARPVELRGNSTAAAVTGVVLDGVSFGGRPAAASDVAVTGDAAFVGPVAVCADGCSRAAVPGDDWTPGQKCSTPTSYCESSGARAQAVGAAAAGVAAVAAAAAAAAGATSTST